MPRGMGRGRGAVEKPKDFGGVMKKLVKFCSRYIPVMIFALVLGAAGTVCQIIGPDKLKDMTNEITKGLPAMVHGKPVMNSIDMDAVSRIAWLLVALYVGYALLSYLQSWLMANVTQRTAQQLREAISQKINRLPLKYFDKVSYGDVLSRITNDVDAIGQTLGQSVGSLITSITLFFGALIMMFYNNVTMTLCAIGSALLGLIIMGVIMKVSQKYFTRQQVALGDVNGHVEEMYTGHTVVKAYCGEERSIEQFEKYNNDLYVSGWKSQFLSGLMMPIMNFVGNFGYVVVCVVGAVLAMDGKIEFGVIVAFMMYIRLFTQPLSQFAQAFQNLQRCAAASERVFGFLEEPELSDETGKQALLGVGADGKPQKADDLFAPNTVLSRLKEFYSRYTVEMVSNVTGMPADDIQRAADIWVNHEGPAIIMYALGMTQHTIGVQNIRCFTIMQLLKGNIGIPGGGIVMTIMLLTTMGLPVDIMGMIAGIYKIIDIAHTTINCTGDVVSTIAVARSEGMIHDEYSEKHTAA